MKKNYKIEREFILSWDYVETFYAELEFDQKSEVQLLIKKMRANGFEKPLRAGHSMFTLIVSRALINGLRPNQENLSFSFNFTKSAMQVQARKGQKLLFDKIEYNDEIETLLKTIELESID